MNAKEFLAAYGRSVHEVTIEVAKDFYLKGESIPDAFAKAKAFVDYLREMAP